MRYASVFLSVLSVAALSLTAVGSASSADLGRPPARAPVYRAPPPVVPVYTWSGLYVGGQAGYAWSDSSYTFTNVIGPEHFSHHANSFIGGVHVGAQWQWDSFVFGLEGTSSWTELDDTVVSVLQPGRLRTLDHHEMVTGVGKLGYALGLWMPYVKGGVAASNIRTFAINPATGTSAFTQDWEAGWTVGGGLDYMLTPNWIVGVDFNYYNFKFDRNGLAGDGTPFSYTDTNSNIYSVMARLSYKFNMWR